MSGFGFRCDPRVSGAGPGFRISGFMFLVSGFGFRISGFGFRMQMPGFGFGGDRAVFAEVDHFECRLDVGAALLI